MFHLDADSSRSFTQRQDGVVLTSVQPGDGQFGAGGPVHHGDVILPPGRESDAHTPSKTRLLFFNLIKHVLPAAAHPIRGSSGFFITTVCRGPLRLATDSCTSGFVSPA